MKKNKILNRIWYGRSWAGKAITISVIIHLGVLGPSGLIIILHARRSPPAQFVSVPPQRPALDPRKLEMRAKVQDLSKASARPRLMPRMVAQRPSELALPEIKKISDTTQRKVQREFASVGVSGFGSGIGGGYGTGIGGGMGGGLPIMIKGRCDPIQRLQKLQQSGGDSKCEEAVVNGLKWLAGHQNGDGSWGKGEHRCAMTGLALLAFLGHCETPDNGAFAANVRKGIEFLIKIGEARNGQLYEHGGNPLAYEHAIAAYALAEAYTMTRNPKLEPVVQKSIYIIVNAQNSHDGWYYGYGGGNYDTSVTGWNIQALKAAQMTGLGISGVDAALTRAMGGLKRMQEKNGHWSYQASQRGSRPSLTGVGVLCLAFGKEGHSKEARAGAMAIAAMATETTYGSSSLYAWYYNTQACFQMGGSVWTKWRSVFQKQLLAAQAPDGSWPPSGKNWVAGKDGEVYRTALCVLMLEVYYRYLPSTQ